VEYFPYGETWVDEQRSQTNLPYRFTGKELDPETGMYYFGARYYEPRISMWVSADTALEEYLPTGDRERDKRLPGFGGVFNSSNLGLYTYAHNNPVKFIDPTGNSTWIDDEGNVQNVIEDGDLGIYRTLPEGVEGPPEKVGETHFWDAFISPDTHRPVGRVYLGQSIDKYIADKANEALGMTTDETFQNMLPRHKLDIKAIFPGHEGKSYHGFLFQGKYVSLREAGNILAGVNAASHGMSFEDFQKGAGALHEGGLMGIALHRSLGITFGQAPNWGEIDYQRTRSEFGYNLYKDRKIPGLGGGASGTW
jgi:filamentous hemagglutinin